MADKVDFHNFFVPIIASIDLPINYSYVDFLINMTRKPDYYLYNVGLPSTAVTILALFSFWLPANCGEKISFAVSLLLGLTVFQIVVEDTLPETSSDDRPLLMKHLSMNFIIVGLTLFLTVINLAVHSSRYMITKHRLKHFLFRILPNILCITTFDTDIETGKAFKVYSYAKIRSMPNASRNYNINRAFTGPLVFQDKYFFS